MSKKYIQDSMMLTKEAFEQYIQQQREAQATQYGIPLDEYLKAVASGSVVQAKSPSDLPPKQQVMVYYIIISGLIMWIWISYREHESNNGINVFNVLFYLIGSMLIGWIMLPIAILTLLNTIKIKIK